MRAPSPHFVITLMMIVAMVLIFVMGLMAGGVM